MPADENAPARPHCGVLYADFSTASMWSCFFTAAAVNSCAALGVTACYPASRHSQGHSGMRTTPSAVFVDTVSSWLYWNTPILLPYKSSARRTALSQYTLTLNGMAIRQDRRTSRCLAYVREGRDLRHFDNRVGGAGQCDGREAPCGRLMPGLPQMGLCWSR